MKLHETYKAGAKCHTPSVQMLLAICGCRLQLSTRELGFVVTAWIFGVFGYILNEDLLRFHIRKSGQECISIGPSN
jgi:hypothetical protein